MKGTMEERFKVAYKNLTYRDYFEIQEWENQDGYFYGATKFRYMINTPKPWKPWPIAEEGLLSYIKEKDNHYIVFGYYTDPLAVTHELEDAKNIAYGIIINLIKECKDGHGTPIIDNTKKKDGRKIELEDECSFEFLSLS